MAEVDVSVAHFNTLVHALKSKLLTTASYEEFMAYGSAERLSESLLESSYRTEMAEALTRSHGADAVEEAVQRNRSVQIALLSRRAQDQFGDLVQIFLDRFDLVAVKSLIRSKHHGLSDADIVAGGNPGVSMTLSQFQDFARAESMEALVNQLISWNLRLCRPLRKALADYREKNDPAVLEDAIDMEYFSKSARALRDLDDENAKAISWYLRVEIDRINLRLVFENFQYKGDIDDMLTRVVPFGALSQATIEAMARATDVAAAMEMLNGTRYQVLSEQLVKFIQTNRFAPVERMFDRLVATQLRRLALRDVFGIGVVMDYVWLKFNEGVNLRLIARGLAGSVPMGRVREELFLLN